MIIAQHTKREDVDLYKKKKMKHELTLIIMEYVKHIHIHPFLYNGLQLAFLYWYNK